MLFRSQVKEEVNREVRFQELQQLQQEIQATTIKAQTGLEQKTESFKQDLLDFDVKADDKKLHKETVADHQAKGRSL